MSSVGLSSVSVKGFLRAMLALSCETDDHELHQALGHVKFIGSGTCTVTQPSGQNWPRPQNPAREVA
eukprot:12094725-Alexandrium_andersonii.AAC.1